MSKTLTKEYKPMIEMDIQQFDNLMLDIAHITKHDKVLVNRHIQDENGNETSSRDESFTFVLDTKELFGILDKYGIPHVDASKQNVLDNTSETDVLQSIERYTGYNTFPYSRQMNLDATNYAAAESVKNGSDVVSNIKKTLSRAEKEWHEITEVPQEESHGINYYRSDAGVTQAMSKARNSRNLEFMDGIRNMYYDNAYVQLVYAAMLVYDKSKVDKVNEQFASIQDFRKAQVQHCFDEAWMEHDNMASKNEGSQEKTEATSDSKSYDKNVRDIVNKVSNMESAGYNDASYEP